MRVLTPTLERIAEVRKSDAAHWRERGLLISESRRWTPLEWEPAEVLVATVLREIQQGSYGLLPSAPWVEKIPPLIRGQWPNYSKHWLLVDRMTVQLLTTAGLERRLRANTDRALVVLNILPLFASVTWALRAELHRDRDVHDAPEPFVSRTPSTTSSNGRTSGNGHTTRHAAHH